MNLDDVTLLRGWIRHIDWRDLDAQRLEESVSARKRIKALRRDLAAKSRFYGNPAWVKLWLGERVNTDRWMRKALAALDSINGLPEPTPILEQGVELWFPEPLCAALPSSVKTLANLVDLLESFFAGDARLPELLKPALKTLILFFDDHATQLGYRLNKEPISTALPVPLDKVMPLEHVLIPTELNGEHGSNRSTKACKIPASHDLEAIKSWLGLKAGNAKTYQAYKKELERLLLWAVLARSKAVSSLSAEDCRAYIGFLGTLTTSDSQWVTLQTANKNYSNWKPFCYRQKKPEFGQETEIADHPPQLVLSPKSINYAKTVIKSCMGWLVKQNYLKRNNFASIQAVRLAQTALSTNNRAFTLSQMRTVFAYAESRVDLNSPEYLTNRRTLFMLKFAFSTGLSIHELAAASFGDIECLEDNSGKHYFLRVIGKYNKIRNASLSSMFIEELQDYLKLRGLPSYFDFLPQQGPLIPSLRDKTRRKHLSPPGIHKILSAFFMQMLADQETNGQPDNCLASKLRNASTHWLRHSYGCYLENDKQVPLMYIRDELGHCNPNLNADAKQRQKAISDAFMEI